MFLTINKLYKKKKYQNLKSFNSIDKIFKICFLENISGWVEPSNPINVHFSYVRTYYMSNNLSTIEWQNVSAVFTRVELQA